MPRRPEHRHEAAGARRRLLEIIEALPSLVGTIDPDGRVLFLNQPGRRLLGMKSDEDPSPLVLADLISERICARLRDEGLSTARDQGVWNGESVLVDRMGRELPVWLVLVGHRASDGRVEFYSIVAHDLSSLRRTEASLIERVKELRALYAISRELGRSAVPLIQRLERVNELLPQGWRHPDLTGSRLTWGERSFVTDGFRETPWMLESVIRFQGGDVGRIEIALLDETLPPRDGEDPFLNEERELLDAAATAVSEAIERDRLQNEFIQGQKLETIGRLAGGVAHDFNNLLMVVRGHAEIALENLPEGALVGHDLRQILDATRRGANLTRQLLAFSRRQALQERFMLLGDALREMEPMLRSLVPERIELRVEVGQEQGPVHADPVKLDQVLLNLTANAAAAIPNGGTISLGLGARAFDDSDAERIPWQVEPGLYVSLVVHDTGQGMSPQVLGRVFEPFFTTKPEGHGTGLGLSVVFGIVKQSGGHIFIESAPGKGTTVEILLPRATPVEKGGEETGVPKAERGSGSEVGAIGAQSGEEGRLVEEGSGSYPLGGLARHRPPRRGSESILLVEDDATVRDVLTRILARLGHRVFLASNGREALRVVEAHGREIDLVVSDVVMPEMGGSEFVDALERIRPDLKVVLMSGYAQKEMNEGVREKAVAFLEKPFSPDDVARVIRDASA